MRHTHTPESFADVLLLAQKADMLDFSRTPASLRLVFDDYAADRRTCVEVRLDDAKADVRTLKDYDKAKHRWGDYCDPSGTVRFESRKGLKALRDWLALKAVEVTGYPAPASFSIYRQVAEVSQ